MASAETSNNRSQSTNDPISIISRIYVIHLMRDKFLWWRTVWNRFVYGIEIERTTATLLRMKGESILMCTTKKQYMVNDMFLLQTEFVDECGWSLAIGYHYSFRGRSFPASAGVRLNYCGLLTIVFHGQTFVRLRAAKRICVRNHSSRELSQTSSTTTFYHIR